MTRQERFWTPLLFLCNLFQAGHTEPRGTGIWAERDLKFFTASHEYGH